MRAQQAKEHLSGPSDCDKPINSAIKKIEHLLEHKIRIIRLTLRRQSGPDASREKNVSASSESDR